MSTRPITYDLYVPEPARPGNGAERAAMAGAAGVAVLGFITSFDAVSHAMRPSFGTYAPLVPLGVDIGILTASAAYISLARRGEAPPWLRWIPHALTGATVYLNWTAGLGANGRLEAAELPGCIAHAVMVLLWAVAVEVAAHVARRRLGVETGRRMDRIRRSRWLLAPLQTLLLWRRMVLWETTSYAEAIAAEKNRILARAELRERHGRRWRRQAPYRDRMLLRLGELAPAEQRPALVAAPEPVRTDTTEPAHADTGPHASARTDARTQRRTDTADADRTGRTRTPAPTVDRDAVVAELAADLRAAVERGEKWHPDYAALQARTGLSRSWCEKAVRDARRSVWPPHPARTDDPHTDTRTDSATHTDPPAEPGAATA